MIKADPKKKLNDGKEIDLSTGKHFDLEKSDYDAGTIPIFFPTETINFKLF